MRQLARQSLGGAGLADPPPLGSGSSRYGKVRTLQEAQSPELRGWLRQAASIPLEVGPARNSAAS